MTREAKYHMSSADTVASAPLFAPQAAENLAPIWHTIVLSGLVYGPVILALYVHRNPNAGISNIFVYLFVSLYELLIIVFTCVGLLAGGSSLRQILSEKSQGWYRTVSLGIAIGVLTVAITVSVHILFGSFYSEPDATSFLPTTAPEIATFVLSMCIVVFAEELVFRGYLLHQIRGWNRSAGRAVILQAAAFVAAHGLHQTVAGVTDKLLFGLLLGWVAVKCRNLFPGIVAHLFGNFVFLALGLLGR